jgi:abortive infection bacteriophage resistance protein
LTERIREEAQRSRKEQFVRHFLRKYGDSHQDLPLWMATEVMSFGTVLKLFGACSNQVKNMIASPFGVRDEVFNTWLWTLNEVRNICAHHGRLWNRDLGNKPRIPHASHHPDWHVPVQIPNHRVFATLTICVYCLKKIAPESQWSGRVLNLLTEHSGVPRKNMGFPDNWLDCPIWKDAREGRA